MDIGDSFQNTTDAFFSFIPRLLGFLVILLIGYIVARIVAALVGKLLQKVGLDRRLHESDAKKYVDKVLPSSPSAGIARVVFWIIFILFLIPAISQLRIPALTTFMNDVLAYLPNVLAAILIFLVAALIAGAVAAAVVRFMGDTPTGKIVASVVPALIMVIALFMILEQLQIAEEIVRIAFAATMGALALALALAFGLGGRSVAERMLEDAYRAGQENKDRIRADIQAGRERAEQEARHRQQEIEGPGQQTQAFDPSGSQAGYAQQPGAAPGGYDQPGAAPGYGQQPGTGSDAGGYPPR